MADHFDDPDHRQILRADDRPHARFAHVRTRAAEEFALRPAAAQFAHQFGGVVIAGGFSGGNQMERGAEANFRVTGLAGVPHLLQS